MGGFSAFGGTTAKECLLALEGVSIGSLPAPVPTSSQEGLDPVEAVRVLSAADPALAGVILETGPFVLEPRRGSTPFERLAEAVVHQQLSNAIAATITGRVKNALNGDWTPEALLRADHELLRACGLSQAKANTLRALAEKTVDGTIPGYRSLQRMTDQEIVERLTTVKGVGVWTAQMFLMFSLLRPDVMPATDYGIRRGFQIVVRTPDLPTPAAIEAHAECWRPYRTVASWYLWRAADKSRQKPS
jgi:3-methyladenine DNA glycosylase/8-oxoguanine DNA glycosylase